MENGLTLDGVTLADCTFSGGTRAVSSASLSVTYPVYLDRLTCVNQSDCGLFLTSSADLAVWRCQLKHGGRAQLVLWGTGGTVRNLFCAPGNHPYPVVQYGGLMAYDHCQFNHEHPPYPAACVALHPAALDGDPATWPTGCRIVNVHAKAWAVGESVPAAVRVFPRTAGYTGPVAVESRGTLPHESRRVELVPGCEPVEVPVYPAVTAGPGGTRGRTDSCPAVVVVGG